MDEVSAEQTPPKDKSLAGRARAAVKSPRWWFVLPVPLLVLVLQSFGPEGWKEPLARMFWLSTVAVLLAIAHFTRRVLMPTLDMSDMLERVKTGNVAAAIVVFAAAVFMAMVFSGLVSYAKAAPLDARTYVPANAQALLPLLKQTQTNYWPEHRYPSYFGALIEQESCISLTHSRCWNSRAQLKTAREEGAGIGQLTRAYREDGTLRFDALAEVRALDPVALRDFTWSTVYTRADLSMTAILVKLRDCDRRLSRSTSADAYNRLAFCDAAYNGGAGGLSQDRTICALTAGCDPNRWFGHVENTSNKSRTKWQGYGQSAFGINREHVTNSLLLRRPKYAAALGPDLP